MRDVSLDCFGGQRLDRNYFRGDRKGFFEVGVDFVGSGGWERILSIERSVVKVVVY